MATYILLSTLSTKGVQTLKANPARLREVNRDVEELVRLEIQRRLRQPRVAPFQHGCAQKAQALDSPLQQVPDERFRALVALQGVKAALDGGGRRFFDHERQFRETTD